MRRIVGLATLSFLLCPVALAGSKRYTTKYDPYFKKYSKRYFGVGFNWRWFKAQAVAESDLNQQAESWAKAKGIMQLLPSTFEDLRKRNPELRDIDEPRWNIAAGIYYDRRLWNNWKAERPFLDRLRFTFGSYNAGLTTLLRAQKVCRTRGLNENYWDSIVQIAPLVPRWRHRETLAYVDKIKDLVDEVDK
ncbi:MAG: transglycosylase SLT domain-containing protein [bacterium]